MRARSEHALLVEGLTLTGLCLCELFALGFCGFDFLLLAYYSWRLPTDQTADLKVFILYLALKLPDFLTHRVDLNNELRILSVLLRNLYLPLLFILLICSHRLIQTDFQMIPDPIELPQWAIGSPLDRRVRLINPSIGVYDG